jgi:hypothetical protein
VPPLIVAIPGAMLAYAFSLIVTAPSWPMFVIEAISLAIVSALGGYRLCLSREQRIALIRTVMDALERPLANGASAR